MAAKCTTMRKCVYTHMRVRSSGNRHVWHQWCASVQPDTTSRGRHAPKATSSVFSDGYPTICRFDTPATGKGDSTMFVECNHACLVHAKSWKFDGFLPQYFVMLVHEDCFWNFKEIIMLFNKNIDIIYFKANIFWDFDTGICFILFIFILYYFIY